MNQKPSVLVVDDDPMMRAMCAAALANDYHVVEAQNGREALRLVHERRPDVVLLDVGMPVMDGWEACRRIRAISDAPVIMVTAHAEDHEVVRGLDAGADDYIAKPFRAAPLLARVRAALRRRDRTAGDRDVLTFDGGNLVVDTGRRAARVRGAEVRLSATEYRVLEVLARSAGQVLTHDEILERVWGQAYAGESGYVRAYVGLLRDKIEEAPHNPRYLLARRGLGYYLDPHPDHPEPTVGEAAVTAPEETSRPSGGPPVTAERGEDAPDTLRVDPRTYTVTLGGRETERRLSAQEFLLLSYLYENRDRVCTRQELGDAVWGAGKWELNMLHRLVHRVKEKIEPALAKGAADSGADEPGQAQRYIRTIPWIGYRLMP